MRLLIGVVLGAARYQAISRDQVFQGFYQKCDCFFVCTHLSLQASINTDYDISGYLSMQCVKIDQVAQGGEA